MRYYLRRNGKLTSITVSDELSQYLIIKLGGSAHDRGAMRGTHITTGKGLAQHWINVLADSSPDMPEKNVSQWIQAQILHFIVDPEIRRRLDEVEERHRAYQEAKAAGSGMAWPQGNTGDI